MGTQNPPKLLMRFFRWFCDPELVWFVEGDLIELYQRNLRIKKKWKSNWIFFWEILKLLRPSLIKNFEGTKRLNYYGMLRNYIKSAWRNFMKHKGFSTINVLSLSIGIAACMVIYLFIRDERSFDAFHQKKEQIYRLCEVQSFPGTNTQNVALSMPGMGPTIKEQFPEVMTFTRFWNWGEQLVEKDNMKVMIEDVAGVDSTFFNIFDFGLISGDKSTAFNDPNNAVISEETALKLFGHLDILDESLVVDGNNVIIKGVSENVPENSHLQFDILLSIRVATQQRPEFDAEFGSNFLNTYLILNQGVDVASLTEKFPEYLVGVTGNEEIGDIYQLFIQPLTDVHLASMDIEHDYNNYRKFNGTYINIFLMVGIFILIIASLNFMNLTTARASNRAKEVGVRKSIGAQKDQLFNQFITESILLSLIALLLAFLLLLVFVPLLNMLIDRQFSLFTFIEFDVLLVLVGVVLLLGTLAGLYPSLYLSSFKPVIVLKGFKSFEKKSVFRSSLIVVQFSLALGMIISTLIVLQQLNFIKNKDIGFAKDHIVLVTMSSEVNESYQKMKQALLQESTILGVTASNQRLGNNLHQWGFKLKKDTSVESITPSNVYVDYDFLDVYDIELVAGRSFSKEYATDDGLAFIVNEAFIEEFGVENPIGQKIGHGWYHNDSLGSIIGVTKDFNFNSLHFAVNTLAMEIHSEWDFNEMSIKINGDKVDEALAAIERVYGQFVDRYPLQYQFLDDQFEELYKSDQQMGSVITIIAILSIFIGSMGLFGLASISVQRRIKEVGIRKVMGATNTELLVILTKTFTLMILLAFLIATPLTYIFISNWLEGFAFRIQIDPIIFILGGVLALIIAIATISYHVLKAARANPIHSLRLE